MNEREILVNLEKAIQRRDQKESARLVRQAVQNNELDAWRTLVTLASSQTAVQDRETVAAVRALRDIYLEDKNPLFAVKAALILAYYRNEQGGTDAHFVSHN
jgi:lipopolysaccharide biosynthesis regulator YciM